MATTTNYSWTTPDDTALVKDGAAAIRSLGTSIDTTTKNLNPSTTLGDIEYRSSSANTNTRLAIGTSGQALTVVAGVPSWAASATSVLTTTGDLLYASAANTLARRGIGTTGQVLTVSGGLPVWSTPASGGKVLQVVHANTSSTTTITSTTFTDIGLSASITPSATTSKILVLLNISQCASRNADAVVDVRSQLLRGATVVPTSGQMVNGIQSALSTGGSLQVYGYVSMSLLDEPATTSATTYKVQGRLNTTASSAQAVFNGTQQGPTSVSSITLLEIGA